jgi:DNA-binding protein WhiA
MRADASIQIGTSGRSISFKTETATVARKIYNLLKQSFDIQCEITIIRKNRLKKNLVYLVRTGPKTDIAAVVSALGGFDGGLGVCCAKSFLRGMFLGCGSVIDPDKGYHLEYVLEDEDMAAYLVDLSTKIGIRLRVTTRKGKSVCYLKDADEISALLVAMGGHSVVLDLESIRVVREMRNGVNRLVNCETANVDKVVSASLRQSEVINFLVEKVGLEGLPDSLRELAGTRLSNPDVSLRELGEMMSPKLGKSGVNHRMRRLIEMASSYGFPRDE